jgi:hypothetical protein
LLEIIRPAANGIRLSLESLKIAGGLVGNAYGVVDVLEKVPIKVEHR